MMKLYAALRAADVPEDKAAAAAEEAAGFERDIAAIKGDLALLKWMVGVNVAFTLGLYVLLLRGIGH
jgi:hypothetical protein